MTAASDEVLAAIPHRPPFLFVDRIIDCGDESIRTERLIREDEPHFAGHYPGKPIMPGVLLCEAVIQTGAILVSRIAAGDLSGVPVLTRLSDARFKQMVKPGDLVTFEAEIKERLANVFFMKGRALVGGKKAVTLEFACTLAPAPE